MYGFTNFLVPLHGLSQFPQNGSRKSDHKAFLLRDATDVLQMTPALFFFLILHILWLFRVPGLALTQNAIIFTLYVKKKKITANFILEYLFFKVIVLMNPLLSNPLNPIIQTLYGTYMPD